MSIDSHIVDMGYVCIMMNPTGCRENHRKRWRSSVIAHTSPAPMAVERSTPRFAGFGLISQVASGAQPDRPDHVRNHGSQFTPPWR